MKKLKEVRRKITHKGERQSDDGHKRIAISVRLTEARNDIPDDEKESIEIETEVYVPKSELRTIEKVAMNEDYDAREFGLLVYDEVYRWALLLERVERLRHKQLEADNDEETLESYYAGLGE